MLRIIREKYKESEVIYGLYHNDKTIYDWVYYTNLPIIVRMVITNSGSKDDAKDVYHDALLAIIKQIRKKEFFISCTLSTYIYSVCRHLWLKKLRSRKFLAKNYNDLEHVIDDIDFTELDAELVKLAKKKVFWKHFACLKEDCKVILNLTFKDIPDNEIANTLGMNNKDDVIKRRSRCKFYLMQSVRQDPLFNEVFGYE